MSTILTSDTNAIAKLDLGKYGGIRRVPLSSIYDPTTSKVSFSTLTTLALKHSFPCTRLYHPVVTYIDVDGEDITISTDRELTEAFEQLVEHPENTGVIAAVLRMKVVFVRNRNVRAGDIEIGERWAHLHVVFDSLVMNMKNMMDEILKDAEELRFCSQKKFSSEPVVTNEGDKTPIDDLVLVDDVNKVENDDESGEQEISVVVAEDTLNQLQSPMNVTEPMDCGVENKYTQTIEVDVESKCTQTLEIDSSDSDVEASDGTDWEVLDD